MRRLSRTRLLLFEMLVNLLVFCVGAAICLMALTRAYSYNAQSRVLAQAQQTAENAAMAFRAAQGDLSALPTALSGQITDDVLTVWYSQDWRPVREENGIFRLVIDTTRTQNDVIRGKIRVLNPDGDAVIKLTVSEYVGPLIKEAAG